jgi:hypothetical protein
MARVPGREPYRVRLHPHGVPGPPGDPAGAVRCSTTFRFLSPGQEVPLPCCRESPAGGGRVGHAEPRGYAHSRACRRGVPGTGCAGSSRQDRAQPSRVSSCGIAPSSRRRANQYSAQGSVITPAVPRAATGPTAGGIRCPRERPAGGWAVPGRGMTEERDRVARSRRDTGLVVPIDGRGTGRYAAGGQDDHAPGSSRQDRHGCHGVGGVQHAGAAGRTMSNR